MEINAKRKTDAHSAHSTDNISTVGVILCDLSTAVSQIGPFVAHRDHSIEDISTAGILVFLPYRLPANAGVLKHVGRAVRGDASIAGVVNVRFLIVQRPHSIGNLQNRGVLSYDGLGKFTKNAPALPEINSFLVYSTQPHYWCGRAPPVVRFPSEGYTGIFLRWSMVHFDGNFPGNIAHVPDCEQVFCRFIHLIN